MFLDEGLHTVQGVTFVITGQEGFTSCHPVLSLLAVSVKELQMENAAVRDDGLTVSSQSFHR